MEAVVEFVVAAPHNCGLEERTEDTAVKQEFVVKSKLSTISRYIQKIYTKKYI